MTPEHLHLALNHVPIIGLAAALVPLLVGFFTQNKSTLISGLVLALACGWATPVVMDSGEKAYERYESGSVRRYLDPDVEQTLDLHEERAETGSKVMYAAAVLATLSLALCFWRFEVARWLSLLTTIACVLSVGAGIWIADSGGKIRRVDFRATTPDLSAGPCLPSQIKED